MKYDKLLIQLWEKELEEQLEEKELKQKEKVDAL